MIDRWFLRDKESGMSSNKKIILAGMATAVVAVGRLASADTITVTDFVVGGVDQNLSPTLVAPNTFAYKYDVNFDSFTNIVNNDGFVIYDFNSPTTFGGSSSTLTLISGDPTLIPDFSANGETTPLVGSDGLNDGTALANILAAAPYSDRNNVKNVVFTYAAPPGPATYTSATSTDLLLTLYSTDGSPAGGFSQGVDNSGASGGFAVSLKPVIVPTSVPVPASWLGGGALFALLGLGRVLKTRRIEA
jgi:hypothetical protein